MWCADNMKLNYIRDLNKANYKTQKVTELTRSFAPTFLPEGSDESVFGREVQKVQQKINSFRNARWRHVINAPEIL